MIDIQRIRKQPELFKKAIQDRGLSFDLDKLLEIEKSRRELTQEVEALRKEQNDASNKIANASNEERKETIDAMKSVATELKNKESELRNIDEQYQQLMYFIPNIPDAEVVIDPTGKNNTVMKEVGNIPPANQTPKSHIELAEMHGLCDFERGVKIAGARGYIITGKGVELVQGIFQLALNLAKSRGFVLVDPPVMVREKFLYGTGHFPANRDEIFEVHDKEQQHFLVGTSEVPLMGMYADEYLQEKDLPLRLAGISACYRTEVGSYGKDTKGLYRVKQFTKVEQLILTKNSEEESKKAFQELLQNAEDILSALELPYRAVRKCTGDMGLGKVEEWDLEAWMPSRKSYGETHTCSRFHDFQSRRLNIKYKDKNQNKFFVHTLNNTIVASPRILIPFLEIHQQPDGTIKIPKALQKYVSHNLLSTTP